MNRDEERIEEEAAAWHVASTGDDMDWVGFTRWLEADARHRLAFDEVALADAWIEDHREALAPEIGDAAQIDREDSVVALRPRRRWPLWTGAGIAASLAAVMIAGQVIPPAPETIASGNA